MEVGTSAHLKKPAPRQRAVACVEASLVSQRYRLHPAQGIDALNIAY